MLSYDKMLLCRKVMSSRAFYAIVLDAVKNRDALSVVRMGDGEKLLLEMTENSDSSILIRPKYEKWIEELGLVGIPKDELRKRLMRAEAECDYFAPSVSGLYLDGFNLFDIFPRPEYVDNFYVNDWTEDMKKDLFKAAGHVLLIHKNAHTADSMQLRVQANLKVKVTYLPLSNWDQTEDVIVKANQIDAPLVLFSGGPAGKYIGSEISTGGRIPKVVLDLGNGADHWTFDELPANRQAAEEFHHEWQKRLDKSLLL